ncbi:MAG: hypothetical protein P8Y27_19230 [Chromatiaceae bacterium]
MLSTSTVSRRLILLERHEFGELVSIDLQAMIVLARCPRCGTRIRVLPYDVLPYKQYSVAMIAELASSYAKGSASLRSVAWDLLGERTPAHTTLHGWTDGLGAHVLGLPGGEAGGVPFSRFVLEARAAPLAQVVEAPFWVDERRYRCEARREHLAGMAMLMAVAELVAGAPDSPALAQCRRLTLLWSNSCVLVFPSRFSCTAIEQRRRPHGPGSRHPPHARRDRCPTRARSPPGASSRSPPSSMPASMRPSDAWPCASARASPWRGRTGGATSPSRRAPCIGGSRRTVRTVTRACLPKVRADRGAPRRAGTAAWIGYAIGLLYEQPNRSLTQLDAYLKIEFADYRLSRSSLACHLRAHPAFNGSAKLRKGDKSKLRALYEAQHPHEGWLGEWVRSNPLRATFVLVRLPKQGRQAKTAAGKRARW